MTLFICDVSNTAFFCCAVDFRHLPDLKKLFTFDTTSPRLRCHPEVTSDQTKSNAHGVFPDQNCRVWDLVPAHNSMIRGHFGLGMV